MTLFIFFDLNDTFPYKMAHIWFFLPKWLITGQNYPFLDWGFQWFEMVSAFVLLLRFWLTDSIVEIATQRSWRWRFSHIVIQITLHGILATIVTFSLQSKRGGWTDVNNNHTTTPRHIQPYIHKTDDNDDCTSQPHFVPAQLSANRSLL